MKYLPPLRSPCGVVSTPTSQRYRDTRNGTLARCIVRCRCAVRSFPQRSLHPPAVQVEGRPPVVDHKTLAVHGVQGLRIADCSVAPTLIRGGGYALAVLIGERAADFIASGA